MDARVISMGYDEFDDGYGGFSEDNIEVWNSGSVYYDDEIVEYQGKYYMALCKTSAQVPGRTKSGIWKEVSLEEIEDHIINLAEESYDEEPIKEAPTKVDDAQAHKAKMQAQQTLAQRKANSAEGVKGTAEPKATISSVKAAAEVNARPVNTSLEKKSPPMQNRESLQRVERKMTLEPNDQEVVNEVLREITFKKIKGLNSDENAITSKLLLPQKAQNETSLQWESSHPQVITATGEVKRPTDGQDVAVNLSVTVKKAQAQAQRFFTLWVKAEETVYSDEECVDMTYDMLDFDQIKGQNEKVSVITENLELLTHGVHDTEIFWASNDRTIMTETGEFLRENLTKNTRVRLFAIITKGNIQKLKYFDVVLKL